ncbi:MAG: MBL fold metallo-hydrolase, partial [Verrucomicrobiia bacterium]
MGSTSGRLQGDCLGPLETNAWWYEGPGGLVVFDAPEGLADRLKGQRVEVLILTHGHFDHMWDAARIQREHRCPVWFHEGDADQCAHPEEVMRWVGLPYRIEPVKPDRLLVDGERVEVGGRTFRVGHAPGHSPGSVVLYEAEEGWLIGGDVLFAGGVGRWDLPGGSREML